MGNPRCMRSSYTPVPMVEEKAAIGIQKLLQAEQKAAEVVAEARADKVRKLKLAKDEAETEIAEYKKTREAQFVIFSKERLGDSGAHKLSVDKETSRNLSAINARCPRTRILWSRCCCSLSRQ